MNSGFVPGESEATSKYLDILGEPRKSKYADLSYGQLFDAKDCEIYFEDLRKTIIKYYDIFKHIFGGNKEEFELKMKTVNKYRSDAHAKEVTKEEMEVFRLSITFMENKIDEFSN